jgi:hypothetical protein
MTTITLPDTEQSTTTGPGRYAHYVKRDSIVDAVVFGNAVEALCGYVWVPSRDPKSLPVCPECQAIYDGNDAESVAKQDRITKRGAV